MASADRWGPAQYVVFWAAILLGVCACVFLVNVLSGLDGDSLLKDPAIVAPIGLLGMFGLPAYGLWRTWRELKR